MGYVALRKMSLRRGNMTHNLRIGHPVPEAVIKYWQNHKDLQDMVKAELIKDVSIKQHKTGEPVKPNKRD